MFTDTFNFSNLLVQMGELKRNMRAWVKKIGIMLCLLLIASLSFDASAKDKQKHGYKPKKTVVKRTVAPSSIKGAGSLAAAISSAITSVDSNLNIGVVVKSMKYGDTLYSRNAHRSFVPASIMKILTAEAALLYLGPNYKFQTNFYTDAAKIDHGVVYGNLYLVHSGDPTLTYNDLLELMETLKNHNIKQITGNVYIDTTAYDQVNYGPGWIWDDKRYCYAAPISASIINHNCLSFQIAPAKTVGSPASIVPNPHHFYFIKNEVITKASQARSCYIRLGTNPDSSISVSGCMPRGRYAQGITTVISDIVEYNKAMLRTLFRRSGVIVNGDISSGEAPSKLSALAIHESKPLHELITEMLKKSDNIIAGSIFKKLGETYSRQPGSWENGSRAVAKILEQKARVNISNMTVLDGSGLSRDNLVTPGQMLQILDFAYHNTATNYDFISSLPVAGVDGTLKHRLSNIAWKVRAKTGTMKGVNSLAGYTVTREKEPLAFVIIVNGNHGLGWRYKELEDQIVTAMAKFSR